MNNVKAFTTKEQDIILSWAKSHDLEWIETDLTDKLYFTYTTPLGFELNFVFNSDGVISSNLESPNHYWIIKDGKLVFKKSNSIELPTEGKL